MAKTVVEWKIKLTRAVFFKKKKKKLIGPSQNEKIKSSLAVLAGFQSSSFHPQQ